MKYSLIGIFIDGLSNTGYDKISSEKLKSSIYTEWLNMPDEHKFLNSKVDSRYLTVMSDLEYYYRCYEKNLDKWYNVVKEYMRTLDYHLITLSKEEYETVIGTLSKQWGNHNLERDFEDYIELSKTNNNESEIKFYEKLKPLLEEYNY